VNTLEILIAALSKIPDEAHWTQGSYARAANGNDAIEDGTPEVAFAFCAVGALYAVDAEVAEDPEHPALVALAAQIGTTERRGPTSESVILTYNDDHEYAEVKAMYARAIARLQEQA
jgi:hypothetical protein